MTTKRKSSISWEAKILTAMKRGASVTAGSDSAILRDGGTAAEPVPLPAVQSLWLKDKIEHDGGKRETEWEPTIYTYTVKKGDK